MEPIKNLCSIHFKQEINMVCIDRQCDKPLRLVCPVCVQQQAHQSHKLITLKKYLQIKENLQKIDPVYKKEIQAKLTIIQNRIKNLLSQIQNIIQQQFLSYDLYQRNIGQEQQFSGEISLATKDPLFIYGINGKSVQQLNQYFKFNSLSLISKIDQYEEDLVIRSHQFIELLHKLHNKDIQINKSKLISKPQGQKFQCKNTKFKEKQKIVPKIQNDSSFLFSDQYKPQFFILSSDKKSICRKTKVQFGLSMYGIVQKPLTKQFSEITFKITKQSNRFVYIGVCDIQKMKKSKYRGCYQLGGGMNSIRQSQPKKSGVCLHNSNKQYSDKPIIGFDFGQGDTITLYINFDKKQLNFVKNINKQKFIMPIDINQEWYPFVGLKYEEDCIQIVK